MSVDLVTLETGGSEVAVKRSLSNGNRTLTLTPLLLLDPDMVHTLSIEGVTDIGENLIMAPVVTQFTTGAGIDLIGPAVVSTTPPSGATDVPTNVVVSVVFDEPVNPLTVTETSFRVQDLTTSQYVAATRSVSVDGQTLTLIPDAPLDVGRRYRVSASVLDLAGNTDSFSSVDFTTAP